MKICPCHRLPGEVMKREFCQACHSHGGVMNWLKLYSTCNYFIMFKEKSLAKLCLRAANDIFNVLPPNICHCLQCKARGALMWHNGCTWPFWEMPRRNLEKFLMARIISLRQWHSPYGLKALQVCLHCLHFDIRLHHEGLRINCLNGPTLGRSMLKIPFIPFRIHTLIPSTAIPSLCLTISFWTDPQMRDARWIPAKWKSLWILCRKRACVMVLVMTSIGTNELIFGTCPIVCRVM